MGAAWCVLDDPGPLASAHPAATMGCSPALVSLLSRGWEAFVAPQPVYFLLDRSCNGLCLVQRLPIGETQDGVDTGAQVGVARNVPFRLDVMAVAVEFNHQLEFAAEEIGEPWADRHLAAEFRAEGRTGEAAPQRPLRRSRRAAQGPGAIGVAGFPIGHLAVFAHP